MFLPCAGLIQRSQKHLCFKQEDDLFRITFMVEDKNLPKVLHALTGLVLNMEPPVPVGNAKVAKGKIIQAHPAGSIKERMVQRLGAFPDPHITTEQIKALIKEVGGNAVSYAYVVAQLKEMKQLKLKKRGLWLIQKKD